MSKNLKETTIKILKQLNRNPAIYFIFIAIFGCAFFVYEFFNTFSFNLNTPIENWVATATYFNNVLTPILTLITILLLALNLKSMKKANSLIHKSNKLVINQNGLDLFVKQVQITRDKFLDNNLFSLKLDVCEKFLDVLTSNTCIKNKVEEFVGIKPITLKSLVNKTIDMKFDVKTCLQLYKLYKQSNEPFDVVGLIRNSDNFEDVLCPLMGVVIVEKISKLDSDENITDDALISFKYLLEELYQQKEEALFYTLYIKSFKMNFDTDLAKLIFEFDTKLLNEDLKEELRKHV